MGSACEVDFYVLAKPALDGRKLACRLALMALERGQSTVIAVPDPQQAQTLDELLWSFPEGRFVPHGIDGTAEAASAPVRIALADRAGDADCLINLCRQPVADPGQYQRLVEIVPFQKPDREASRAKFRYYRERGLDPKHHEIAK